MRQLYLAVALPKIMYGIDTWYIPPYKPVGATKNSGSVATLRALQKLQQMATLAITGTLRTTPTDFLDMHAGTLPMGASTVESLPQGPRQNANTA